MWPRTVELMLGCWLLVSPFVFRHPAEAPLLWINDFVCGALVAVTALVSFAPRARYLHLLTAGVSLWLIAFGYFYPSGPVPPALQNDILAGLVLLMLAIIPNEASSPPPPWRKVLNR